MKKGDLVFCSKKYVNTVQKTDKNFLHYKDSKDGNQ